MKEMVLSWALNWLNRKNVSINEVFFENKYCIYLFIYIYRLMNLYMNYKFIYSYMYMYMYICIYIISGKTRINKEAVFVECLQSTS